MTSRQKQAHRLWRQPLGWACAVLLLVWASPSFAEPLRGIKGHDDRVSVDGRQYPWSAVGRLTKGDGSLCSGVLIGPDTVLTAAHCLWNEARNGWATTNELYFAAGMTDDIPTALSGVVKTEWPTSYRGVRDHSLQNSVNDWAILTLREPIGLRAGWFDLVKNWTGEHDGTGTVTQVGFSVDRRATVHADHGCHLRGWVMPGLLAHDCDAVEGDSGSALLLKSGDDYRVLGIHVSTFGDGQRDVWGGAVPAVAIARSWAASRAVAGTSQEQRPTVAPGGGGEVPSGVGQGFR